MFAKFIIIAIIAEALLSQNKAMASCVDECPQWVKLNTSPVCFGAKGNQYGHFTYSQDISVRQFMLVYRSGTVSCKAGKRSYWGCAPNSSALAPILTDQQNTILAPDASDVVGNGWYTLAGYTSSSSILVFCAQPPCNPLVVPANSELRLWYGEDLRGKTEGDNSGKTCADVYALLA